MLDDRCLPSVYEEIVHRAMKSNHPLDVIWELTHRCNLRCRHCYITDFDRPELDTETCRGILEQLAEAGVLWLTVTGGEPFMRSDLFDLLGYARDLKFAVTLFTNGTLIDSAAAERLSDLKLSGVEVSIYGASPAVNDPFTGVDGSFRRSISAVEHLLRFGVPVTLKTCIVRSNFNDYSNIEALAAELGVRLRSTSYLAPRNDGDTTRIDACRLTDEQVADALRDDGAAGIVPDLVGEGLVPDRLDRVIPCGAGHVSCGITPDGSVLPCLQFVNGGEDLSRRDFLSIWNESELFERVREVRLSDVEPCNRCPGLKYCFRCPGIALIEDGDLLGPSRESCRITRILMGILGDEAQIPPPRDTN